VQKNNPGKDKKHDNRNHHHNHQKGDKKSNERPHQKDSAPKKEDRELAEWRAKIVLNSAPAAPSAPIVEEPAVDEPMPELSNEELFSSPASTPVAPQESEEKVEVIGIRFRSAGKVYYFDPRGQKLKKGDFAIVETARGPEFGEVNLENTMVNVSETVTPLRPIIRVATPADIEHNEENREKEKNALVICQEKIEAHKLDMKLIDVQYAFDNSKLLFYFSSDGRVDFRELVKDLASVFRTRIELRQIGIRDEAKMLGGIGSCGRMLCCTTFLPDFAQVSIKMAKEQGLSLNSAKISGMCGRLMCCLHFEAETYTEEIRRTPAIDSLVKTEDGIGTVISTNPLAGTIRVIFKDSPDTPPKQYHRSEVTPLGKAPKNSEKKEDAAN
jgi:cell fate regulator YaaT (PSP1 superfamily)